MEVPLAAWPMHSDHPRDTVLITKILEVGLVVKDLAQQDELVTLDRMEKVVRILMESKEGEEMRKNKRVEFWCEKCCGRKWCHKK